MEQQQPSNGGPWLLAELPDVSSIVGFPVQCTQRIKYTCFDVSKSLLIFGATSGGLYVFNREPCSFIQLIPNKEGSIVRIKISPQEKSVAFATHKGLICVSDCGSDSGTYVKSSSLQISKEHQGNEVTSIIWSASGNELYAADDTGIVSKFQISKSFAKNVFQNPAATLMRLDSRVVQLDLKDNLLLVSTLTRCFVCDTQKEHYAQVGQKLRDGEYGACFYHNSNAENGAEDTSGMANLDINKPNGAYNILSEEEQMKCFDKSAHLKIFCARPGSRLWEVKINGTVICTHQFKQLLAIPPAKIIRFSSFESEELPIVDGESSNCEPQSVNFSKLYLIKGRYIFSFRKEGFYILDPKEPTVIMWNDQYDDIVDCNIVGDIIYLWRMNGTIATLAFYTVEKFLLKCFINEKFRLCAKVCAQFSSSLIASIPNSNKIHLISSLGEKLQEIGEIQLLDGVCSILEEIEKWKKINAQKAKVGIVQVENTFSIKNSNCETDADNYPNSESPAKYSSDENDSTLFQLSPEAVQALKDFGNSVSDKLTTGTKSLKKTWDQLEGKMKKKGTDKNTNDSFGIKNGDASCPCNNFDSEKAGQSYLAEVDNNNIVVGKPNVSSNQINGEQIKKDKTTELIYHYIKVGEISDLNAIQAEHPIFSNTNCDIDVVYKMILKVEDYMISLGDSSEYSSYQSGKLLLLYISKTPDISKTIDIIMESEDISSYFLQAFAAVNSSSADSSCECGYPLPSSKSSRTPLFLDLLNIYIEKKWESSKSQECYDICKKVPYMWRKILLLRKNEDLHNLLLLILQMLDEDLLYAYLPQFTVTTWERAIKLWATLKKNECLNCGKTFETDVRKNNQLSWDSIGAIMIKSMGCRESVTMLKSFSRLIPRDELTLKFYHSCLCLKLFEKYDATVSSNMIDALYRAYDYEDAVKDMCEHLKTCLTGGFFHTALPISVASKSEFWGLTVHFRDDDEDPPRGEETKYSFLEEVWLVESGGASTSTRASATRKPRYRIGMSLDETLDFLGDVCPNRDCPHCCLPLSSRVLVADAGLWAFGCGHTFHGVCLKVLMVKLCPMCFKGKC